MRFDEDYLIPKWNKTNLEVSLGLVKTFLRTGKWIVEKFINVICFVLFRINCYFTTGILRVYDCDRDNYQIFEIVWLQYKKTTFQEDTKQQM